MTEKKLPVRKLGTGCGVAGCEQSAVGTLWPRKVIGQPLAKGTPGCQRHLDLAYRALRHAGRTRDLDAGS